MAGKINRKENAMTTESNKRQPQVPVMSLAEAFKTIQSVGRGEAELPDWAGKKVYVGEEAKRHWEAVDPESESLDSFSKLFTDNRDLIATIARENPESVAALARMVHRDESNVSRTLGKLERFGLVKLVLSERGRTKRPVLVMEKVRFDLDLISGQMSLTGLRTAAAAR